MSTSHRPEATPSPQAMSKPLKGILKKSPRPSLPLQDITQQDNDIGTQRPYRWAGYKGIDDLAARIAQQQPRENMNGVKAADAAQQRARENMDEVKADSSEPRVMKDESEPLCPIDHRPFVKPVKTRCCGTTYCYECIFDLIERYDEECPNCRKMIVVEELVNVEEGERGKEVQTGYPMLPNAAQDNNLPTCR